MELEGLNGVRINVVVKLNEEVERLLEAIAASPELATVDTDVLVNEVMAGIRLIAARDQIDKYLRAQREECAP